MYRFLLLAVVMAFYARPALSFDKPVPPDMKAIKKAVTNPSSGFYFPTLFDRFRRGDPNMSLDEKRNLYFGYAAQDAYSPYPHSDYQDSVRTILKYDALLEPDYIRLLAFTDSVLKDNPFDLRNLGYSVFAAKKLDRTEIAEVSKANIDIILNAIISTGDGKTSPTAFWVIEVSHEYVLLDAFGLEYGGSQSLVGTCDFLTLGDNKEGLKGLYFNVSTSLNAMTKMFKD